MDVDLDQCLRFGEIRALAVTNVRIWRFLSLFSRFLDIGRNQRPGNRKKKTLAPTNVRILQFFGHWAAPMSVFGAFVDVDRDQCFEFSFFKTLAASNVFSG
jgi:hypothetical protein